MWHLGMWFIDEHSGGAELMFKLHNLTGFLQICWLYNLQNYCKGVFLDSWVAGLGFFFLPSDIQNTAICGLSPWVRKAALTVQTGCSVALVSMFC